MSVPSSGFGRGRRPVSDSLALEALGNAERHEPRVQSENIGGQAGVVAVGKGIGDRRLVEQVLDVCLEHQTIIRALQRHRQVGVVP